MSLPASLPEAVRQRIQTDPAYAKDFYMLNPSLAPEPSAQPQPAGQSPPATVVKSVTSLDLDMTLPIRLYSITNIRAWKVNNRHSKEQRAQIAAWLHGWAGLLASALPLSITITRIAPRDLDNDNLQASAKHVRDAIARIIGLDDRDPRITWETVLQERRPKTYAIRIQITHRKESKK